MPRGLRGVIVDVEKCPTTEFCFGTRSPWCGACALISQLQFADQGLVVPLTGGLSAIAVSALQPMYAYPTNDVSIASLRYGIGARRWTLFTWDERPVPVSDSATAQTWT